MPKVLPIGLWETKNERFVRNLKAELCRKGKDYRNLMKRTGRSQSAIYKRYHEPDTMTVSELRGFIQEADLSEAVILDFLFKNI